MGAETFMNVVHAVTAKEAYQQAKQQACYEHGHGGYTGTIAEKSGYTMSNKPDEIDADDWVEMIEGFDEDDTDQKHYSELKKDFGVYDDKWGDALCIDCGKVEGKDYNKYILCGWASS